MDKDLQNNPNIDYQAKTEEILEERLFFRNHAGDEEPSNERDMQGERE